MRATTIRLPASLWAWVEREAAIDGVSASQFIRDATLLRLGYRAGERGDGAEIIALFERVISEA